MKYLYFSGFCLENESEIFDKYIIQNELTASAFSYGCQQLVQSVLNSTKRLDTIQLFSPSFFNDKDDKYKRMQLIYFQKDSNNYCSEFLKNCGFSKDSINKYFKMGKVDELKDLLYYHWDEEKLQTIVDMGIKIEIYLGDKDKIVNTSQSINFFKQYGEVYLIKGAGHIL